MIPARYDDFSLWQGSAFDVTLTYKPDGTTPANLSSYQARMKIRSQASGAELVSLTSNPAAGITLGGVAGTIRLYISALVTATYGWLSGVYDLELIPPSGEADAFKLLYGQIILQREQTF